MKTLNTLKKWWVILAVALAGCTGYGSLNVEAIDSNQSINGSMAQYGQNSNHLFVLLPHQRRIASYRFGADGLLTKGPLAYGRDMETLFPTEDYLFVGTMEGVSIYDLKNELSNFEEIGQFRHIRSCDPVVVQGNYAYSTLRSGTVCGSTVNRLDVIDISDITNPQGVGAVQMSDPHGLGVDGNLLFVCEGAKGLKVFSLENPIEPILIKHFQNIHAYDLIPANKILIAIGDNGILQYDYTDPENIQQISQLL
ncbi:hypothetical protein PEPS_29250 (plasmid) [Persicobacter psychrovividus]|uniref:LVIVD repeat-containing protein n=2 Tax=Persicobacter psychrovividus TaxID=387638 RepID=A0ABN6LBR8_9BACT|nr:hypothetical protein PEPS_29250 [Persicobacter psychrovividus]